jgi:hypothetical protein
MAFSVASSFSSYPGSEPSPDDHLAGYESLPDDDWEAVEAQYHAEADRCDRGLGEVERMTREDEKRFMNMTSGERLCHHHLAVWRTNARLYAEVDAHQRQFGDCDEDREPTRDELLCRQMSSEERLRFFRAMREQEALAREQWKADNAQFLNGIRRRS